MTSFAFNPGVDLFSNPLDIDFSNAYSQPIDFDTGFDLGSFTNFGNTGFNWDEPFEIGGMSPSQLYQQPLAGAGQQGQQSGFNSGLTNFAQGILGAAPGLTANAGQRMAGNLRAGAMEAAAMASAATAQGQARGFMAGIEGERLGAALRNQAIRNAQELGQTSLARQGNAQRYLAGAPGGMRQNILNSRAIYGV